MTNHMPVYIRQSTPDQVRERSGSTEAQQTRVQMFQLAKEAKIRYGLAVSRPPVGYVQSVRGKWVKDPDIKVREAVQRVFDLYLKLRSTRRVETYCHQHHLPFPKRVRWEVRWKPITARGVYRLLTNPTYAGDYVYQRSRHLPGQDQRRRRLIRRPSAEWLICRDHHEAYVSRRRWEVIQTMLAACRLLRHQRVDPARLGVPLPADLPPDCHPPIRREAIEIIAQRLAQRRSQQVIAEEPNTRGSRPPRASVFTVTRLKNLYRALRRCGFWRRPGRSAGTRPLDGGP